MQESPLHEPDRAAAPEASAPSSSVPDELARLVRAVRRLFGAQLQLLATELGLARSAVSWLLAAALLATVAGVALGLTLLGLVGLLLAIWFKSWIWALLALALLQILLLAGAIATFRRCLHWMSLPTTRHEWRATLRETLQGAGRAADPESKEKAKP